MLAWKWKMDIDFSKGFKKYIILSHHIPIFHDVVSTKYIGNCLYTNHECIQKTFSVDLVKWDDGKTEMWSKD